MADNQLKYVIDGDASGLTNAVGQANKAITGMNKNLNSSKQVTNSFNQILRETPAFAFSAQTGILAISNNLPIFTDAITQARKNGESFGSILKGLGTSLFSVGSVLSIGTLAITLFADKLFGSAEATKEVNKELDKYESNIKSAVEQTANEASKVTQIVDRLKEGNLSRSENIALVKELQKISPDYFSNLDAERVKISDVTSAYINYNSALVKTVEAQVKQQQLTELIRKRLDLEQRFPEASKQINDELKKGLSVSEILLNVTKQQANEYVKSGVYNKQLTKEQEDQIYNLSRGVTPGLVQILSLYRDQQDVLSSLNDSDLKRLGISNAELQTKQKETKEVEKQISLYEQLKRSFPKIPNASDQVGKGAENGTPVPPRPISGFTDKNAQAEAEKIRKYFSVIENAIAESEQAVKDGFVNGIIGIADAFGSALATGGIGDALAAAGESLLKIMGTVLQEVGKQMIIASELVQGLKIALKTLFTNPIAGVAVGVGLVALGGLLKNIQLAKVPAFAEGGIVSGPTLGLVGEAGREAIIPLDRIGEVLGSVGGAQSVFVTGQLSGETIYLQQQRTANRRGRFV